MCEKRERRKKWTGADANATGTQTEDEGEGIERDGETEKGGQETVKRTLDEEEYLPLHLGWDDTNFMQF